MEAVTIVDIIIGSIFISFLLFAGFMLLYLKVEMYFLTFKLENHPLLIQKIESVLAMICEKENLKVFHKSYDELNANEPDANKKAYGKYIYTLDDTYKKEINDILAEVEAIEVKYGKPYEELCRESGVKVIEKERFHIPRIVLCNDEIQKLGICSYYGTYFHELGHHFVHKEMGEEFNTEENADKYAAKLVKENLPHYFLLFSRFGFWYTKNGAKLTQKEKIRAFIKFLLYLKEKRNKKGLSTLTDLKN